MNYLESFRNRVVSLEEAVSKVKSGDRLAFGHAAAEPQLVPDELIRQRDRLHDVQIFHLYTLGDGKYLTAENEGHFRHVTSFVTGNSRDAVAENRADYIPCFLSEVPRLFDMEYPIDIAFIQVSTPDEDGWCSFGASCDYTKAASEKAKLVIAEVNDQTPYVGGDNKIHISKLDYIIPMSMPLYELPIAKASEVDWQIGRHCADLIEDGDTLQVGIGAIPCTIIHSLGDKRNLGIHTEMFSDSVVELMEKGVITGSRKTLHPGKLVATFMMGSKKLYDFVDHNPDVELYPVDYVNDPRVIAQNDNLVSINSSMQIDLQGQTVSECIGLRQFSGTGGQVDYLRGAAWSKGGRSIIALPSTASNGTVSRIVPFLTKGAAVTASRNDVDYVVTEWGVAKLRGKSLRERARALTNIAHPDFRECLEAECAHRFK